MDVVANRVDHKAFPDSFCEVIKQRKAFSWYWYIGKEMPRDELDWVAYVRSKYRHEPVELAALSRSLLLAKQHLISDPKDRTGGSLYYMTPVGLKNQKRNIKSYQLVASIQDHMFFNNINWR